jgi:hypothetical protein
MNWIEGLLDPLLDHLATKLALKVRAQLDGAIDAALDRAEDRIATASEGLEERLQAAATKPIADLKVKLGPVLELQQQALATLAPGSRLLTNQEVEEAAKAAGMTPAADMRAAITSAASSARAAAADRLRNRLNWPKRPDR